MKKESYEGVVCSKEGIGEEKHQRAQAMERA